jgi:hypothetical protein
MYRNDRKKEMPLESYYIGHQDAKLTDEQRKILVDYFKKEKAETERRIFKIKNHGKMDGETYCIF